MLNYSETGTENQEIFDVDAFIKAILWGGDDA